MVNDFFIDFRYQLYVNGRFVCRGPARGFHGHWPYDYVDIAEFLNPGRNLVAIRAYHPGSSCPRYVSAGMGGVLVAARWGRRELVTDKSWKCRREIGIRRDAVPASSSLFPQEHVDKRLEPDDWMQADFDDTNWSVPLKARRWNAMPWFSLEPRMIPMLVEQPVGPMALLGVGSGFNSPESEAARDVALVRAQESLAHKPVPTNRLPTEICIPATQRGMYCSYLLDFGRTVVGNISISVSGAEGGELVDMVHSEGIDAESLTPWLDPVTWSHVALANRMICRPGSNAHTFYHPYGFRYLMITVRNSGVPLLIRPVLNSVRYPLNCRGAFISSDSTLTDIWSICAWTQQCCALDVYVDTPFREQNQWWGDARIQGMNTFLLDGDTRLFRRGIHCLASQTTPDGLTYGFAPSSAHNCILPDFTLIWMLTIWDYYWQTADPEPFITHEPVIRRALGYFFEHLDLRCGLVAHDPRYWLFLDWAEIFTDGYSSVYNLWFLLVLERMSELYNLVGRAADSMDLSRRAGQLRSALQGLCNADGLLCDGLDKKRNKVKTASVHTQTMAIMLHVKPAAESQMIALSLLPCILRETPLPSDPSIYWISYVFTVLGEQGYGREVVAYIRKIWTQMVAHGSTWERLQVTKGESSLSHAWSAHPLFHLMQIVGGVRQSALAWREIHYTPVFEGDSCLVKIPTPAGVITSYWEKSEGEVQVKLSLPAGVRAIVKLPGREVTQPLTGTNCWVVS